MTDIHRKKAAKLFGKPEHLVTDDERRRAKAINLGEVYGIPFKKEDLMDIPIHRHKWTCLEFGRIITVSSVEIAKVTIVEIDLDSVASFAEAKMDELLEHHNKLVEEHNELQGKGIPNLDDADNEELEAFLKVPTSLTQYAWHVKLSRVHREKGNVGEAERYEKINEGIYNNLPDWAKW